LKKSCPETPIIIVANKIDLRNDRLSLLRLDRLQNLKPIETAGGKNLARNLSVGYVECSSSMGVSFHTILNIFILQLFIYIFINSLQFFQEWIEKYFR
jgi:GTPase SAR1 family protein